MITLVMAKNMTIHLKLEFVGTPLFGNKEASDNVTNDARDTKDDIRYHLLLIRNSYLDA